MASLDGQPERDGILQDLLSRPRIRHITEIRIHNLDVHAHLAAQPDVPDKTESTQHNEPSSPILENRAARRTSQGSVQSYSLKDVREIAEDRMNGEVSVIEEEPDGESRSSIKQGRHFVERSTSSSSLGRIARSPRLTPRRASSNDTITEQSAATAPGSRGFGARPGLSAHGRSRSRLIVPRPPTEVDEETHNDEASHAVDIIPGSSKDASFQSRARSGSISSLRSAHHQYHHHHHHHARSSQPQHSTSLGTGGRRERASTIVSQYAINTTGHVTLTDELGYEKKDIGEGSSKEQAFDLDEAVLREEKELVRCFVTMILVEDLRAALREEQEQEEYGKKTDCVVGRPERSESGEAGKNGLARSTSGTTRKTGTANGSASPSRPKIGKSSISTPESRPRAGSKSQPIPRDSPSNSPKAVRPRLPSGTTVPGPSKPTVNPAGRIRPPASRQNTLRAGSFSQTSGGKSSSPNRVARLSSPPASRMGSPPTSPSLRAGSFGGSRPGSRRSSETTLHEADHGKPDDKPDKASPGQQVPTIDKKKRKPLSPFYISPVHRKSLYPTFSGISVASDYADWVSGSASGVAEHQVLLEAWYESSRSGRHEDAAPGTGVEWLKLEGFGGLVDLANLREVAEDRMDQLPDNTLIFRFSQTPSKAFYLPHSTTEKQDAVAHPQPVRRDVQSVVERSMRETKMQRSVDLEGLERLVAVSRIVKEGEAEVVSVEDRLKVLMGEDGRRDDLTRLSAQKGNVNSNLGNRIDGLRQANEDIKRACADRRQALAARRERLLQADDLITELDGQIDDLDGRVSTEITGRKALSPATYRHRARLVNNLDTIFPIVPLDPSSLLYSILSIPLPIPTDPKSPAPPTTVPSGLLPQGIKVDEETTATALGMVAMCLQRLAEMIGEDLLYPVTCLGSRSLVRDNISVITGPRSFPLYSKGIEKYRYEYAIFLLNKDIEMMMIQAGIMIQDPRHTLPNLKTLLLTLASRDKPPVEVEVVRSRAGGAGVGSRSMTPSPFSFPPASSQSGLQLSSHLPGPPGAPSSRPSTSRRGSVEPSAGYTRSVSIASLTALTGRS